MARCCRSGTTPTEAAHSASLVELPDERSGRHRAVGVLAELGELVRRDAPVKAYADPAAVTDVRRHEEVLRLAADEFLLRPGGRGQPKVREMVLVVPVGPDAGERLPPPHEERRCAVTGALLNLRQAGAGCAYSVDGCSHAAHESDFRVASPAGRLPNASAPLAQLAEQLTLNQRVPGSSPGWRTNSQVTAPELVRRRQKWTAAVT